MASKHSSYDLPEQNGGESGVKLLELPADESKETDEKGIPQEEELKLVGVLQLFRYSDKLEKLMMFVGFLFSLCFGVGYPYLLVIWGQSLDVFIQFERLTHFLPTISEYLESHNLTRMEIIKDPKILDQARCDDIISFYGGNTTCTVSVHEGILDKMWEVAIHYGVVGADLLVAGYISTSLWLMAAERQANRMRQRCLFNVLSQSMEWFDTHKASELNSRLSDDIVQIQNGIGDKIANLLQWTCAAIAAVAIGISFGWKYTLVMFAVSPIMFVAVGLINKLNVLSTTKELKEYAKAGGIAEEVFGAIKTVVAFGGQEKQAQRYHENLDTARRYGIRRSLVHGLALSSFNICHYSFMGFAFWYGAKLHRDEPDNYTVENVMVVVATLLAFAISLGNSSPSYQSLAVARGAAYEIFKLIEMKSPIDCMAETGKKLTQLRGVIQFKNVQFAYPARPDVKVLDDVSLEVQPGQTVALVGASGCGKSTTVQLLMRFYDPAQGQIFIDGCDVRELNVTWYRKNIGLVSQEPVLFATTIGENIRYGREEVTEEELIAATKKANAYDFIMQLPDQFETFVGEGGAQLSGGQKQRIAIARALVRDPKILLLDEATSSLDTENESIVQDALDKAREGRTTLVIAHRLSTIKNADVIFGIDKGQVVESGTHDVLMEQKGIYYQLVTNQTFSKDEESDDDDIEEDGNKVDAVANRGLDQSILQSGNEKEKEEDEEEEVKNLPKLPLFRLLKMNAPEWYFIVLGCAGSIMNGCMAPIFVIILSSMQDMFSEDEETRKKDAVKWLLAAVGLGFCSLIVGFLQTSMFGLSGESLTSRLRDGTFRAMLKQDIAWFDDPKNASGTLATRLSTDASQVQGVTGARIGVMLQSVTCMIGTLVIAFTSGWKMALVVMGVMPLLVVGSFINYKMQTGQATRTKEAFDEGGRITSESLGNIRTVASLSKETMFYSMYLEKLRGPFRTAMRNAHIAGMAFGYNSAMISLFTAVALVFGSYMMEEGEMTSQDVYNVLLGLMLGSEGIGRASAFAPDYSKAQISARRIIQLLDSVLPANMTASIGKQLKSDYSASVSFKDVNFSYKSRENVPVLQEMTWSVNPGQTLALVGSSGSGKSTAVQLIERFYDTVSGCVSLDDQDIKALNVDWLRSQMSLVSQEPVLFDQTISENIAFGDASREVPMDEIVQAARTANIHTFITSLPDGYDTNVGSKGTQLSGGQKQRIAIARALVRNPRILLLDEATSSLDTESEKVVQEALDKAREGRTCVTIAHRLATVQTADRICVIRHGTVVEEGTHSELMAMKGFYKKLVEKSMRSG